MRLLIVAYYFPPAGGGGVQRVLKFAKYLPEFGVEVDVLTPDDPHWVDTDAGLPIPAGTTVHRSRYRGPLPGKPADLLSGLRGWARVKRRLLLQPRRVMVPDLYAGWIPSAVRTGRRVVRERKIDVLLSTSPPETDHLIGRAITRRTGIPWVVDMRDSWLDEPGLRMDSRLVRVKVAINRLFSARTVGVADRVLSVSEPIVREQTERYPKQAAKNRIRLLMNGVDLDDFVGLPQLPTRTEYFTLVYTGNFFGRRSPRPLLEGVRLLLTDRPDLRHQLRVRFVGSLKDADVSWIAADATLADVVEIVPFEPYREVLAEQRAADMLYLAISEGDRHAGEVTGKLFEYVAARRPILAVIPPAGAAAQLLAQLGDGAIIITPSDHAGIAVALEQAIDSWSAANHTTADLPWSDELEQLVSRRERARQLAAILHELVPPKG